jgi:hypothetical protein
LHALRSGGLGKYPDYEVMHGGLRVGRIYRQTAATSAETEWLWAINGVHGPPEMMAIPGTPRDLLACTTIS